ncbi:hypothetical protein GGQ80_001887 [Sphingomonas jinjuensis]|uniref:HTH lysR-type domain-containing protein n=1 Tax=Sphingomonas jinjuensis TaxID=535907 RepID=A0A840FBD5_9SPHN|nr:LysR family transcriptional regulator [Sphingomonas jinjuensis]MBB4153981.1 hypothetical protein [Sphingomonas jinjuensis]
MAPIIFELLDLRALIATSDMHSFHRAAEQLALSQPSLSRRIQKLEQAVGAPLLERSSRSARLTPAGQQVYLSIANLFDRAPPLSPPPVTTFTTAASSAYDPIGRYFTAGFRMSF